VTSLLDWRLYDKRADNLALRRFTCTDPPTRRSGSRGSFHPKPWEREVQSFVRQKRPNVPFGEVMILGHELADQRIGAVCRWAELRNPGEVLLQCVAVSVYYRYRNSQREYAKEAIETAKSAIAARARVAGSEDVLIYARIHHRNSPSRRMCGASGFRYFKTEDDLETWACNQML
jgi:hypothetical protein